MDNKKINIYLFYLMSLLQGMIFYAPIATLYRQVHGLSVLDITVIEGISLILMIILEIPWGYVSDIIGYKKTIILCNILYVISKIVFWKADSFSDFLIERLILSFVLAGISGCDTSYIYLSSGEESSRSFSIYEAANTAGLLFASLIFSCLIKNDFNKAGFFTVITYSLSMILSFMLTEVKVERKEHDCMRCMVKDIFLSFNQNKKFIMFLIAAAFLFESNQTITVFLSQIQFLNSGIQPEMMGYVHIMVTLAGLASSYSFILIDNLGENKAIRLLFCTAISSCFIMAFITKAIVSVICVIMLRVSASLFIPAANSIMNKQVTISSRATMMSIYSSVMNVIAVVTNLIFGRMADINIKYAMLTGTAFCISGLILFSVWQYQGEHAIN